jgi:hypothetical protein
LGVRNTFYFVIMIFLAEIIGLACAMTMYLYNIKLNDKLRNIQRRLKSD